MDIVQPIWGPVDPGIQLGKVSRPPTFVMKVSPRAWRKTSGGSLPSRAPSWRGLAASPRTVHPQRTPLGAPPPGRRRVLELLKVPSHATEAGSQQLSEGAHPPEPPWKQVVIDVDIPIRLEHDTMSISKIPSEKLPIKFSSPRRLMSCADWGRFGTFSTDPQFAKSPFALRLAL